MIEHTDFMLSQFDKLLMNLTKDILEFEFQKACHFLWKITVVAGSKTSTEA